MERNIILIGFMGTGKSAIGQRLAQRLGMTFVDTDNEIEALTGMSIDQIFRKHGEKRFRSEEKLLAAKLARQKGLVIACGGGIVLNPDNIRALSESGIVIRLEASAQDIYRRVMRKRRHRPLIRRDLTLEGLQEMIKAREEYYQCADFTVDTSARGIEDLVQAIIDRLEESGDERPRG